MLFFSSPEEKRYVSREDERRSRTHVHGGERAVTARYSRIVNRAYVRCKGGIRLRRKREESAEPITMSEGRSGFVGGSEKEQTTRQRNAAVTSAAMVTREALLSWKVGRKTRR